MPKILLIITLLFVIGCAPAVRTKLVEEYPMPPLAKNEPVIVINPLENVPSSAIKVGKIKVKDSGLTLICGYDLMLEKAKIAARRAGANLLKIEKHILPAPLISSCHQIEASIYSIDSTAISVLSNEVISQRGDSTIIQPVLKMPFPKFRIALSGGFSFLLAKVSNQVPAPLIPHIQNLKTGGHYSADISYFWQEKVGVGIKYINFITSSSTRYNNGQGFSGLVSDDITTQFIGPIWYNRSFSTTRDVCFLYGLGLGYINHKNEATFGTPFTLRGGTLGLSVDLGADFKVNKNLSLGVNLGYLAGALKQYKKYEGTRVETIKLTEENYESMARLDVAAGIRFNF